MPIKKTDKIIAPSRLTDALVAGVIAQLDGPDAKDKQALARIKRDADLMGIDGAVAMAQVLWETGNLSSERWNNDFNIAGVAITGDDVEQPFTIASAEDGVDLYMHCLYSAVTHKRFGGFPVPKSCEQWFVSVWLDKVQSPAYPTVQTIDDLNIIYTENNDTRATWAMDTAYQDGVPSRGNSFLPGVPDQGFSLPHEGGQPVTTLTFGKVPHPVYVARPIRKGDGQGVGYYGQRHVNGVVLHRMIGTLWGTDEYFKTAAALTDYGVGVLAQDGAANDGVIIRWNDPLGDQSGWASGVYSSHAYGDGAAFVAKYATGAVGINAINRDQTSVEISGITYTTAFSEKAKDSVAAIMAYWADQYHIPWDVFPIAPQDGFSFIRWHDEFGPENGQKPCPGDVVKAATADLIERARAIMKEHQTTEVIVSPPEPPVYQEPGAWPWLKAGADGFGEDHMVGGTEVIYAPADFTAQKATPRYATGSRKGPKSGPNIKKGTRFHSDYAFRSATDNLTYRLTVNGNRVLASALLPRDGVSKNGTLSRRTTKGGKPIVIRKAKKKAA